ncbi:ATP-binding protein [Sphingomonas sp. MMS12-HWE2-04]|uniref:ATP-binding protein n=1 Tax=Sphingomonas sp. MMS12-HWE2-04 TaxID=3234199 RepID=UPI00384D8FD0
MDVSRLIEGIVDLIRRTLGPTIAVVLEMPPQLPSARVDPNQLELALLNLSINARDAMPGGGKLTLSAAEIAVDHRNSLGLEPGNYLRVTALDTGAGMDRATLERATEPFFSTKGIGKGTGLGLSMVHGLAAQSGGTLNLQSALGIGTSVELWLPATDDNPHNAMDKGGDPVRARGAARVLLVDDEDLVRSATADMLRDLGYVVVEASSANQALAAMRSGVEADVLVSDYLMPTMTGGQLITELRASGNAIPALLVTGYAAAGSDVPSDVVRLAKPFRQADLAKQVDELLCSVSVRQGRGSNIRPSRIHFPNPAWPNPARPNPAWPIRVGSGPFGSRGFLAGVRARSNIRPGLAAPCAEMAQRHDVDAEGRRSAKWPIADPMNLSTSAPSS